MAATARQARIPKPPAAPRQPHPRERIRVALVISAVALGLRLVHVWQIRKAPFFDLKLGDAAAYDEWAKRIAAGDWFGHEVFYQAPLYPYVLAAVYATVGSSSLIVRVLQAFVSAASCALVGDAGWRLFSKRAGLAAGLILATYPPAIFLDTLIQKSVLDLFLLSLVIWTASRLGDRGPERAALQSVDAARGFQPCDRGPERAALQSVDAAQGFQPRDRGPERAALWRRWLQLGCALGALSLTRENALVLAGPVAAWIALRGSTPTLQRLRFGATFAAGLALVLAPVAARNAIVGHELFVTTAQFGPNLYIGNNPQSDGIYRPLRPFRQKPAFEQEDAVEIAEQTTGHPLTRGQVSAFYTARVVDFIKSHPVAWVKLLGRKFALTWNEIEISDTEDQYTYARWSWPVAVGRVWNLGVLAPLALLGIWITASQWRKLWIFHAMLAAYVCSVVAFYVFARYRYPIVPFLTLFAGAGLAGLPAFARSTRSAVLAACAVAIGAAALFCRLPLVPQARLEAATRYNTGVGLERTGREEQAIGEYQAAIRLDPALAVAHNDLGLLFARRGQLREAASELDQAARLAPENAIFHNSAAVVRARVGDLAAALEHLRTALRLEPSNDEARRNLAGVLVQLGERASAMARSGRLDLAAADLRLALEAAPDRADLHNNLGIVLATQGELRAAADEFERALALKPGDPATLRNLERLRRRQ